MTWHPHPHTAPLTRRALPCHSTTTTRSPSPPHPLASTTTPLPTHSYGCKEARGGHSRDFGSATGDRAAARPTTPHTGPTHTTPPPLPPPPHPLFPPTTLSGDSLGPQKSREGTSRDFAPSHTLRGGGRVRRPSPANPTNTPPLPTPPTRLLPGPHLAHSSLWVCKGRGWGQPRLWGRTECPHSPPRRRRAVGEEGGGKGERGGARACWPPRAVQKYTYVQ